MSHLLLIPAAAEIAPDDPAVGAACDQRTILRQELHAPVCMHVHTCECMCAHVHIHVHVYVCMRTCMHACMRVYMCARMHACTYVHVARIYVRAALQSESAST